LCGGAFASGLRLFLARPLSSHSIDAGVLRTLVDFRKTCLSEKREQVFAQPNLMAFGPLLAALPLGDNFVLFRERRLRR
jgi:hypothetical protein